MIIPLLVTLLSTPQPPRERPADPVAPVAALPARVAHDLGRLAARGPLIALAAGAGLAGAVHGNDAGAVRSLSSSHRLEESLDGGAVAGDGFVQVGTAVAVYAIGGLTHSPDVARVGSALVEAQVVNGILTEGAKLAAGRRRPDGGGHSFPSGHTSATFATADVLQREFGWKVGLPAYLGAAYVGASRVAERRHYLSDVAFGAAIGIASSRSLALQVRRHTVSAQPALLHGAAAVVVTVH
jgi:membrane-associated phospholipid phosphatase